MKNQHPPIGLSGLTSSWAISAMNQEIYTLANLPKKEQGRKIGKPNSLFSVCLLKIASICKGDGASMEDGRAAVHAACSSYLWLRNIELNRQYNRAWDRAKPRTGNTLSPAQNPVESYPTSRLENRTTPRFMVNELDLTTGRFRSYALLEGEPATKARKLIADIKSLLQTGEQPPDLKYTLHAENCHDWTIPMWRVRLHFSHSTKTLKTIIDGVAIHFNAVIEKSYGGVFTLAIPE